jgi:hypothetical protein
MVGIRVELPVQSVIGGSDLKRVTKNLRARVRSRPQLNQLRTKVDYLVVPVARPVIQGNLYAQSNLVGVPAASTQPSGKPRWPGPFFSSYLTNAGNAPLFLTILYYAGREGGEDAANSLLGRN